MGGRGPGRLVEDPSQVPAEFRGERCSRASWEVSWGKGEGKERVSVSLRAPSLQTSRPLPMAVSLELISAPRVKQGWKKRTLSFALQIPSFLALPQQASF